MFKIDSDPAIDAGLNLTKTPFGLVWVFDDKTRLKEGHHVVNPNPNADGFDIAGLVCARICHDLINPIGAISNGVELMLSDLRNLGPEMALVSESAEGAVSKIQFFRIAFGPTNDSDVLRREDIAATLVERFRGTRIKLDVDLPPDLRRWDAKLIFLMVMCLETAMPLGGALTVQQVAGKWRIRAESDKLRPDDDLWKMLAANDATADLRPSQVQFLLLPVEIQRQHRRMNLEFGSSAITINF